MAVTFVSSTPAPSNPGAGDNIWNIPLVATGTGGTITVTVAIAANAARGYTVDNLVGLAYDNAAGFARTPVSDTWTTTVVDPFLTITKTATPVSVTGGPVMYTLTVTNTGDDFAYNVVVTENYPAQVTYQSSSIPPSVGDNVWFAGTIPDGGSWSVTIVVVVTDLAYQGNIVNNVSVACEDVNGEPQPMDWDQATTLIADPLMTVTKTATAQVSAGATITYTITYTNTGTGAAYNVVINELYPAGTTFVGSVPAATSGNNQWVIPMVAAGASGTITITVLADDDASGALLNTVYLDYDDLWGLPRQQVMAEASTLVVAPYIVMSKTGPATAYQGEQITYTITATNIGTGSAYNLTVVESYPVGVTYVNSSEVPTLGDNVWVFPDMGPGMSGTLNITVLVGATATGTLLNNVTLDYENDAGVAQESLWATATTTIIAPALWLNKTAPATVNVTDTVVYVITYGNDGDGWASGITITETFPAGMTFVSSEPAPTAGTTWDIGTLAPGASGSITVTMQATGVPGTFQINWVDLMATNLVGLTLTPLSANATTFIWGEVIDTPPTIVPTAPAVVYVGDLIPILAEVRDNETGIVVVTIYWLNIDGTQGNGQMAPVDVDAEGNGNYTLTIPAQAYKGIVSLWIWANDTTGNENRTGWLDVLVILPPYIVFGDVFSGSGDLVPTALVLITNDETNETTIGITNDLGLYSVDLGMLYSGYQDGDQLTAFGTDGAYYGYAYGNVSLDSHDDSTITWPSRRIDVTLNEIPEFGTLLVPMAIALLAFVVYRRRKRD